ncbi:MAG: Gfo/Idh/MocA family oxidoreductase [Hyphomonas sp.]|nr:Gfo/Idh/MocA family oxidoreductase [Hyphomonas sp.]
MQWGMIGGGAGSQIGNAHRVSAHIDARLRLTAGALDVDPDAGKRFGMELGIDESRAYGNWQEMLAGELAREDRVELVTVATPNNTHYEIAGAFAAKGFNVLCEKPLTMSVDEAEKLRRTVDASGKVFATNFGYSGYPMAYQAREMIRNGDLGDIRVVFAEFAHGFHALGDDQDNPRVRWRYDPAQAGVSSITADCGIHALHMAQFMTGQKITEIAAHFDRGVVERQLEDDAFLALRLDGGAVGRLWTSAIATGQVHGFGIRVFGSKGGLRWHQEFPNQIYFSPIGEPTRILERGDPALYEKAQLASRIAIGHAEGMFGAFGNIYAAVFGAIRGDDSGLGHNDFPSVEDGVDMVRAVHAATKSAQNNGAWTKLNDV